MKNNLSNEKRYRFSDRTNLKVLEATGRLAGFNGQMFFKVF